jgi:hypothetical protein
VQHRIKIKQRKILRDLRKAKADLAALLSYYYECKSMLEIYNQEWTADITFILNSLPKESDDSLESDIDGKKSSTEACLNEDFSKSKTAGSQDKFSEDFLAKSDAPEWAKKVFRKIALKTHPDKIKDVPESRELEEMYSKANQAIMDGSYDALLEICQLLSIECDLDPKVELRLNIERQKKTREKLKKIENSLPWAWGEAYEEPDIRKKILTSILPHYGIHGISEIDIQDILGRLIQD